MLPIEWILVGVVVLGFIFVIGVLLMTRARPRAETEAAAEAAQRTANLEHGLSTLYENQTELAGRMAQLGESLSASYGQLSQTMEERLESVNTRLGQGLVEQTQRTQETLGGLTSRLAVIDTAQQNLMTLSKEVVGLQEILSNKQARGAFGEIQLNDLVKSVLPPNAYAFQVQLSNGRRADCLIKLPKPPGPIAVDAKFPLEAFRALTATDDEMKKTQAQRAFRQAVQTHIRSIAERYIVPGDTADSALMFLPSEAVYAELHANFADLVDESFRKRVWIVSPTTLMATLNTVRAVLKDAQMRDQAHIIQEEVVKMTDDVRRLTERVQKLQSHFSSSEKDVRDILVSTEKIARSIHQIEQVQLGDDDSAPALPERPAAPARPALEPASKGEAPQSPPPPKPARPVFSPTQSSPAPRPADDSGADAGKAPQPDNDPAPASNVTTLPFGTPAGNGNGTDSRNGDSQRPN